MYGHQFSAMELQAVYLVDDILAKAQPIPLPAEFLSVSNLKNDFPILRKVERNSKRFACFLPK